MGRFAGRNSYKRKFTVWLKGNFPTWTSNNPYSKGKLIYWHHLRIYLFYLKQLPFYRKQPLISFNKPLSCTLPLTVKIFSLQFCCKLFAICLLGYKDEDTASWKKQKENRITNTEFLWSASLRKELTFRDAISDFPAKLSLRKERRNCILMTCHYPDLAGALIGRAKRDICLNQSKALPRSG